MPDEGPRPMQHAITPLRLIRSAADPSFIPAATKAITLAMAMTLAGCRIGGGGASFENENDRLREQRAQLQRELDDLRDTLARREAQLNALKTITAPGGEDAPEPGLPLADWPTLSKVTLGRLSGPVDADGDGLHDAYRLYVRTHDQYDRFLPAPASAVVQVVRILPASKADPGADDGPDPTGKPSGPAVELARAEFDRAAFHEAYRSNFTGTHFTLPVDLPDDGAGIPASSDSPRGLAVTVKLTLTDARTGQVFEITRDDRLRLR